jgi:rSAM/selenodomain-associated transferase 1
MGRFRFGDQCIVIRKSFFNTLGGFPNWRLFEDIELMRKARKKTRIYRFPMTVVTSARRLIQNGIIRQQIRNIYYTSLYLLGVSPEKLATMYGSEKKGLNGVYLIIFVRFPHPGKVKTRLATSIGNDKAARLYRLCTENVFKETKKLSDNVLRHIFYADKDDEDNVIKWAGPVFHFMSQVEGDLGIRIEAAFNYVFRQGARKAVIVASDVPDLSAEIIENAINALTDNDIVIGPTNDGGYYLLGMNGVHNDLFHGVTWSTTEVYAETLSIIEYLGLKVHCLRALDDIDTEEDLHRWLDASSIEGNPVRRAMQNMATTS